MTTTISIDSLRELAGFRAGRGCALSLYVDLDPSVSPTPKHVQTRVRSLLDEGAKRVRADLGHDEREALRSDFDRVERFFDTQFDRDGARGVAVFAAGLDSAWSALPLAAPVADTVRIGDEFHIAPLVPLVGRGEGALVAVIARERGSVYRLQAGRLVELADVTGEAPTRHDQGGWAQARLQRHVDALAHEHYKAVAAELEERFRRLDRPRVVIVCLEDARSEIADVLASDLSDAVIGWTSAEAHASPAELERVVAPVLERWRAECESEYVARWQERAGRGDRAASGWAEALEAASDGRVELVLHELRAAHEAVRCPECGRVELEGETCPLDGARFEATPDGLDLAVRQTVAQGGGVWAVEHAAALGPVGGIAALLRF